MPLCGRADLVRVLAGNDKDDFLAGLLGYYVIDKLDEKTQRPESTIEMSAGEERTRDRFQLQKSVIDWASLPFFVAEHFKPYDPEPDAESLVRRERSYSREELAKRSGVHLEKMPKTPPLASWARLQRRISGLLLEVYESRHLNVDLLLHDLSRGRMPRSLPFRKCWRWPRLLNVIIDHSRRLTPFWQDQKMVMTRLTRWLGRGNVNEYRVHDGITDPIPMGKVRRCKFNNIAKVPESVLVLGDCGCLAGYHPLVHQWCKLARSRRLQGRGTTALVPAPCGRWPRGLFGYWKLALWEQSAIPRHGGDEALLDERAQRLLSLISYASRIEPGLLRTIRRLLPPREADAGTEADVWSHADIASGSPVALTIAKALLKDLQARFRQEDSALREKVEKAIRDWHAALPKEIWHAELLHLPSSDQEDFFVGETAAAKRDFLRIAETMLKPEETIDSNYQAAIRAWFGRFKGRTHFNVQLWVGNTQLSRTLQKVDAFIHQDETIIETATGYDPRRDGKRGSQRTWTVRQVGAHFRIVETDVKLSAVTQDGSPMAILRSTRPFLHYVESEGGGVEPQEILIPVRFDPQTGQVTKELLTRLDWADTMGHDEYGVWATFRHAGVTQRLRWIPPGKFMMGSPANEVGRMDNEKQHAVIITRGYWLFDTPVTQALWQTAMEKNPSYFPGDDRPVEQVTWHECTAFIKKINGKLPGLNLVLPTEAQWEYACRAGTTTSTYAGDLESKNVSSILDEIAWYAGNRDGETHPVGLKKPNSWGLYDILGNVYEWCGDWYADYSGDAEVNPEGPDTGGFRVFRGGSWRYDARSVRAAYRDGWGPGDRVDYLGFRCARVQEPGRGASSAEMRAGEAVTGMADNNANAARGTKYVIAPQHSVTIAIGPRRHWQLQTDQGILSLGSIIKPNWADGMGRDRYGLWLSFTYRDVTQRLRWIPPGQFMMGSPVDEVGHYDWEKHHLVTLTRGFWLFDTPVTQRLWQAAMGDNPSRFKSADRPVEQVTWDDCGKFIVKLNGEMPALELRLPTEAEWEYACRAGTTSAIYDGELIILGEKNAPVLDDIAWYGGNSGVGFELENGMDSSKWPEKQYDFEKAGSHPVGLKKPNPWGLYDMLGNVYEWCGDWYGDYSGDAEVDPTGPDMGGFRVYRGGSWSDFARHVRAGFRFFREPVARYGLGFRCARVQEG